MVETSLDNKVAFITGGGTGIGKISAEMLGKNGCKVIIASRSEDHLQKTVSEFKEYGIDINYFVLNITNYQDVQNVADSISENYGRLDILVNNAGGNFSCSTRKLSVNGWNSVININLNGSFYCSKFFGEKMIEFGNGGSIINLVATYGWTGAPGNAHSSASKAGIIALTKTLASEWAQYNIRVNAIAPGPIKTPIAIKHLGFEKNDINNKLMNEIPLRRLGEPEEIAKSVLFLASNYWSSYVTGEVIVVDGGHVLYKGLDPDLYLEN